MCSRKLLSLKSSRTQPGVRSFRTIQPDEPRAFCGGRIVRAGANRRDCSPRTRADRDPRSRVDSSRRGRERAPRGSPRWARPVQPWGKACVPRPRPYPLAGPRSCSRSRKRRKRSGKARRPGSGEPDSRTCRGRARVCPRLRPRPAPCRVAEHRSSPTPSLARDRFQSATGRPCCRPAIPAGPRWRPLHPRGPRPFGRFPVARAPGSHGRRP